MNRRLRLYPQVLARLWSPLPPPSEQDRIVRYLDEKTAEIVERESTDDSHGFRRTARLALDYMRNNYGWRELRIGDVAAALHCSRSHLEKSFRAANGTSPADALREIRLAHVCDLLRSTDKPIDRIAALCGFAPLHLMTAFRRRYGVTMGAFRRNRILPPSSSSFGRSP